MSKLLRLVFHPWLWLAIGLLAVAGVIWIVGPIVRIGDWIPLESERARGVLISLIVATLVLRLLWRRWQARRTNATVVAQLASGPAADATGPGAAETALLRQRFAEALEQLRRARFTRGGSGLRAAWADASSRVGRRYLYELPWYLIIGAPGSGKTTALLNSGLQFPLASTMGEHAIRGVGGTRNCDWWFTDEAVLIDTAGRYTTQSSNADADAGAWNGFLGLLKRSRPRQPVSGVLVTVSVPDLLMASADERMKHAQAVRRRVQELHEQLGIRFPIYLLVTKCDLLAGFTDYLGDVEKDVRATPWGFTFPLDRELHTDRSLYATEFDALEQRLQDGLIERLQRERDPQRRARIYGFPLQFAGLRDVLDEFQQRVFSPSQYEADPMLRGVYFVSGTQEGTPIDRMLGRLSRGFGLGQEAAAVPPGQGKSYFLTRLLREVVFAEAGLAGTNLRWERQRSTIALAGYALVVGLTGGMIVLWAGSYLDNSRYVARVDAGLDESARLIHSAEPPTADPRPLLPRLNAARTLPGNADDSAVPWTMGLGLYQGDKLRAAARHTYDRLLTDALLPSIALRIEQRLRGGGSPELQYEALKAYVMLLDPAHFDATSLRQYLTADWDATLPRDTPTEQRQALVEHLDALLSTRTTDDAGLPAPPHDPALLADTRRRLALTSLPARIYQRLRSEGVGQGTPNFDAVRAGGPSVPLVFRRASGAPITQGIPGLYTYDGYHQAFAVEVDRVSKQLAQEETWVLEEAATGTRGQDPAQIVEQVRRSYLGDYARLWEDYIADLRLVQPKTLGEAVQTARALSAPDTPLAPLLRAISRETTLSAAPNAVAKAGATLRGKVEESTRELRHLRGLFGGPDGGNAPVATASIEETLVDQRFEALRQHVTAPGGQGPAPIDATIKLLDEVYVFLNAADTAVRAGNPPPASEVANKVKAESARAPEPVRSLVASLSVTGSTLALGLTRANLGQALNTQVGDFCRAAAAGRYPFVRSSDRDVTQEDFARLFAPNGLFDDFFQKHLQPFVETSGRTWTFREQAGATMGGAGTLATFQRAAVIRDTFFRGAGNAPALRLDFKPDTMDSTITQFILDVDGQVVRYAHGPPIPVSIQWPGPRGSAQVRVELSPPSASGRSGMVTSGPWALFRMIDKLQAEPGTGPERFRVTFNVDGRRASFEVTTSSVRNPFGLRELEDFRCPSGL